MSQPPQEPGHPQLDDPQTVPHVEQRTFEAQTVPQVPQNTQYGPQWQPAYGYPRRRNTMPWVVFGGGLFVVGMIFTLVFVLNSGPDTDTPEGVAEDTVTAFNDQDVDDLVTLTCEEDKQEVESTLTAMTGYGAGGEGFEVTAELRGVTPAGADEAVAELEITYVNVPEDFEGGFAEGSSVNRKLSLRQESGEWCVSWFD